MRCSFPEFEALAAAHGSLIRARGYSVVSQIRYSQNPLRQLWRRVRKKSWSGWKTFWKAFNQNGQPVFIKVSFGHNSLPEDQRTMDAENEVLLHDYLSPLIRPVEKVQLLDPVDHWGLRDTYFIVYPWNEMQDAANASGVFHGAPQSSPPPIAPGSKQATICAVCEKYKHTPMRNDAMRGYVCLTCIDRELTRLQSQNKGKKQ